MKNIGIRLDGADCVEAVSQRALEATTVARALEWARVACKEAAPSAKSDESIELARVSGVARRALTPNIDVRDPRKWYLEVHLPGADGAWSDAVLSRLEGQIPLSELPAVLQLISADWIGESQCLADMRSAMVDPVPLKSPSLKTYGPKRPRQKQIQLRKPKPKQRK